MGAKRLNTQTGINGRREGLQCEQTNKQFVSPSDFSLPCVPVQEASYDYMEKEGERKFWNVWTSWRWPMQDLKV